jgi:hypothetical protein
MAFAYVRTLELTVSSIQILFNDDVDTNIGVNNISIVSGIDSINNPEIKSVSVENDIVKITFRPLFPNVQYKITFSSTNTTPFQTVNGEIITEDGNRNSFFFNSPGEEQNDIRDAMFNDVSTLYETGETTLVRDLISSTADELQKARDSIETVRSGNYLSVLVTDELKERDDGPIDKLDNGGAFEILRVARTPTGSNKITYIEFNANRSQSFKIRSSTIVNSIVSTVTSDPISLQSIDVINEKITDDIDITNHFNGLNIKVSNLPVIQVISVSLFRDGEYIEYDIERFGYTLKNNRYDTNSASSNVNFDDNEIELSLSSVTGSEGGFLIPRSGDEIYISYIYKKLGRDVDTESILFTRMKNVVREATPPVINKFSLNHAPIVTQLDEIASTNSVEFLNTQSSNGKLAFTTVHPAFKKELPYDITRLPSKVGEYTINHNTGEVYVYGEDEHNSGTGENAPVANYTYREIFSEDLDYTFNSDRDEIAIRSTRNISGIEAKITFSYEDTFAEGTDYNVLSHVEVLNERVNNKLIDSFKIETNHFPVTDVFRILNETTGELYTLDRFNNTSVSFSGRNAPRQRDVTRERVTFSRVPQEILLVSDELTNSSSIRIFKIDLSNNGISDSQNRFVGANFNTSVIFSRTDLFIREFFYENRLYTNVNTNINKLQKIGDYIIDYTNGIVYVAVTSDEGTDLGDISYQYSCVDTVNDHILNVNNIYRSKSSSEINVNTYNIGNITDTTANIVGLEQVGERFINNNSTRTLLIGTHQSGEDGITLNGSYSFVSNSGVFTSDDIGRILIVGSSSQTPVQEVEITNIINDHEITVSQSFNYTKNGRIWTIVDISSNSPKTITLGHDIVSVKNIYTVTQLGTLPAEDLDGYFDINRDSIDGNVITLGNSNPLKVGDAIIVDYNPGNLFIDYRYLQDELIISYEYGANSLDWSISDSLNNGDEYYITYKYGALRESLLSNFGSLTQIDQLTTFSPNLDREIYRSIVGGALQSFIKGPTIPSLERLVESFTDVTPNINEAAFDNWVLGRDNLHLRSPIYDSNQTFDLGKFDNGAIISDNNIQVPALAHLRLDEGTLETWIRPNWKGLSNDASLTFSNLLIDGYEDLSSIYIGFSGANPVEMPFTLSINNSDISVSGEPSNINNDTGFFIWFDEFTDLWNVRWRENANNIVEFTGSISTDGEFFNIAKPTGPDGYEINEITDVITSTTNGISFTAFIDDVDDIGGSSPYYVDGISFSSGKLHYIFDIAEDSATNRMSLFKDGTGYLNFQVFDNRLKYGKHAGLYNISKNIRDWQANLLHHIAISWKFNSSDEQDEIHMFVDGEEVTNLFKYGGNPKANSSYDFGNIAEEIITMSSVNPIVGGIDGSTVSGSKIFYSPSSDFTEIGIQIGHQLYLLDETADGIGEPNFGAPYTITGVGTTTLTLNRAFTLTLGNLQYSINSLTSTVSTPVNIQDFVVISVDSDGNETELYGVDAEYPDYSVRRGGNNTHVITINNGVSTGDSVIIRPLGLVLQRCKEKVYVYDGGYDEIRLNSSAPVSLGDVKITAIILDRTLIKAGGGFGLVGTIIGAQLVTMLQSYFDNVCQPSNQSSGRKLSVKLSGDNFNYNIPGNQVIISGKTFSGAVKETILFTESTTIITDEYWKSIDSITVSVIPIDASQYVGSIEIREYNPITISENNGDFAEVVEYSNGIFRLETYGTAGQPFILNGCMYEVDYPSRLRIRLDAIPDTFYIGSDYTGSNNFDGIIDEFKVIDIMSDDTRPGEIANSNVPSVTTSYNLSQSQDNNENTLLLMHFGDEVADDSVFRDRYNSGFESASSVNDSFGTSIKFVQDKPYIINNANYIFNSEEGTVEFWLSPLDDSRGDPNFHYYIDMSAVVEEEIESISSLNVITNQRIREVESIRLITDIYNTGTNYYTGGYVSNVDYKTITLGIPLPAQNVALKITYIPLNSQGDRVSLFRDPNGRICFFVKASGIEHIISVPMAWKRHTWHRIMAMWKMNSENNQDRLRLFVDGSERGTIKYGTGLIYGTGIIWGQAEVRPGVNKFLVDNIDLTDTFSKIYIGTDVYGLKGARARIDNMRFSELQRLQSIKRTTTDTIDINYIQNHEFASPVVEDIYTTGIYNFDNTENDIEYLATIINSERGIFRFSVEVVDSFDKIIGNTDLEELLEELINVIKPSHCESIISYKK